MDVGARRCSWSEVFRVTKDESPHQPLLAYLDATAIEKHVAPWPHMGMFFARTQVQLFRDAHAVFPQVVV
jgi:hypothetical protein